MSFDFARSLRRFRRGLRKTQLSRRPDGELSFISEPAAPGLELLLDTCVYIDVLQGRAPERLKSLLAIRLCNHSGVALAELMHLFGRLDPADARTKTVLAEISGVIFAMPDHRLTAPSTQALGEAGILAGLAARLASIRPGRQQALLNDATLYLQAIEQGQMIVTRNVREFDWFDQILPSKRVLFYRPA